MISLSTLVDNTLQAMIALQSKVKVIEVVRIRIRDEGRKCLTDNA
jgi:hypothetical protein